MFLLVAYAEFTFITSFGLGKTSMCVSHTCGRARTSKIKLTDCDCVDDAYASIKTIHLSKYLQSVLQRISLALENDLF